MSSNWPLKHTMDVTQDRYIAENTADTPITALLFKLCNRFDHNTTQQI